IVNIDKTAPHPTFLTPADGSVVADPSAVVTGDADGAVTVTVSGAPAALDLSAGTFSAPIALAEGTNAITVVATDRAGNSGSATINVVLDSRAPQLAITSPTAACLNATSITISGTV